jgi:hypothetical protein
MLINQEIAACLVGYICQAIVSGSTDFNRCLPQKAALKRTGCPAPTGLSRVLNGRHRIHSAGAAAPIEIGACHKKLR